MAYEKQTWVNRVVSEGTGQVVEHGTIVSAERLNHLEDGVFNAHEAISTIPKKVSELTNDKGYLVASDIANKVDKVPNKNLSTNDYTTEEKTKLAGIPANTKESIDALQTGLGTKVDKVPGKGLSTEDFTTPLKTKLVNIPEGSNVLNVTVNHTIQRYTTMAGDQQTAKKKFYADIPCTKSKVTMNCDITPADSVEDAGLLTYAEPMEGKVRCYFMDVPTEAYTVEAIELTPVVSSSEANVR